MKREEIRDVTIALLIGGLIGVSVLAFATRLPDIGLRAAYVAAQVVAFVVVFGALPAVSLHADTPQGILVPLGFSTAGGVLLAGLLRSDVPFELKVATTAGIAVSALVAHLALGRLGLPESVIVYPVVGAAAWLLAFAVIVFVALLAASQLTAFTWAAAVAVVVSFLVLFDSLGRELSASTP
jgi:hypothetical protein